MAGRVFVTGANRGLGLAFVQRYAERGARVFAGCRDPAGAEALQAVARDHPETVVPVSVDVTDASAIASVVERMGADGDGSLDILVNNAGHSPRGERLGSLEAGAMLPVFSVNTVAPVIVLQHCLPLLRRSANPRIANISSSMGALADKDYGGHYSYSASKAALNMMTRAAAADLRDEGIVVTSLHPGWVRTDLGGPKAPLSPADSVTGLVDVIEGLTMDDSGAFVTYQGERHAW